MAKTPQQIADKWARNLQNSTQDIQDGVNNVQVTPSAEAVKKQAKLKQNWNASIDNGKWARNLGAVTKEQWQQAIIQKGIPRIGAGAQNAIPKMATFQSALQPYQANIQQTLKGMPDLTLQDNIARMTYVVTQMAKFKKPTP